LYAAVLAQDIKTVANFIGNALDLIPATGVAKQAGKIFGTRLNPQSVEAMLAGKDVTRFGSQTSQEVKS